MRDVMTRILLVVLVATGNASVATAQPAPPSAADYSRLAAELARVQQELREQRQLILQVMEMHSALLRYLQSSGAGSGPAGLPPGMGGQLVPPAGAPPPAVGAAAPAGGAVGGLAASAVPAREGTVTGA